MLLGMTIFLLFPFSRLVHVWSGFASVAYLFRPYQVVRSRRLNLPAGHNQPRQPGCLRTTAMQVTTTVCGGPRAARPRGRFHASRRQRRALHGRRGAERRPTAPARLHRAAAPGAQAPACWPPTTRPPEDGVISEAASRAIEALLDRELTGPGALRSLPAGATTTPTPRRYRPASACSCATSCLPSRRASMWCAAPARRGLPARRALPRRQAGDRFAEAARTLSNCPSGAAGRRSGLADAADCAPRVRPRAVRPHRDRRAAAPGAQPLRPARGRGAGARARHHAGLRDRARGRRQALRQQAWATAAPVPAVCWPAEAQRAGVSIWSGRSPLVQ
jgi:hypothetical protein